MNQINIGLAGLFQFETRQKLGVDADGNDILSEDATVLVPWFHNLITDGGLDLLGANSPADNLTYCRLGTGTTAPTNGDTGLQTQTGATNTVGTGGATGNDGSTYIYRRVSRRFAAGTVSGVALAEVAMASAATGQIFSRSLIKDATGTPMTITLPADQALDVIYEIREYIDNNDVVVNTTVDGAACTVTMRPHMFPTGNAWNNKAGNIGRGILPSHYTGAASAGPGGLETQPAKTSNVANGQAGTGNTNGVAYNAYVAGSFQRTVTINFGLTQNNYATGIGCICLTSDGAWWTDASPPGEWTFGFNPKLNKTSSRLATVVLGFTWGRYTIP